MKTRSQNIKNEIINENEIINIICENENIIEDIEDAIVSAFINGSVKEGDNIKLVRKKGSEDKGDFFRFRYSAEMKSADRDLIHRYIVQKQFEALEYMNQKKSPQYDDHYPGVLTGD